MNTYILDASKVDDNGEALYLDKELLSLKNKDISAYKDALKKNTVSEREFEQMFLSYFGFASIERARKDFDKQKAATFGHRLKDYEQDVNGWRNIAKDRILALHDIPQRMDGNPLDFVNDADADFASSYFDKFKDIFFSNEEDEDNYEHMRAIVAAIIRRRVPMLLA